MASIVWERFGQIVNYVEPFFGSGAVLLGRTRVVGTETVNDADCYLSNFWRAIKHDPDAVAHWADWPVNECDLEARHLWLVNQVDFQERMKSDPDFYDVKIAGWWVWGLCSWIGAGWCSGKSSWGKEFADGALCHPRLPHLAKGRGINKQLPHLGNAGRGINRKLPHLGDAGRGERIREYFERLAVRFRDVRVACGDWARVLGDSVTVKHGVTGVFLDPPYGSERNQAYAVDAHGCAAECAKWAIENGDNPLLRIAMCGYANEHSFLDGWIEIPWKAAGGYGSQANGKGRENSARERIWFSPHCRGAQLNAFAELATNRKKR